MNRLPVIIFSIGILLFSINGCYTVIRHPKLSTDDVGEQEFYDSHITHFDDCSSCHNRDHTQFHSDYSDYYSFPQDAYDYYDWEFYYGTPWWVDPYYISRDSDRPANPLPPTQRRDIGRRGTAVAPSAISSSPSGGASSPGPVAKRRSDSTAPAAEGKPTTNKRTTSRRDTNTNKRKTKKSDAAATKRKE